MQLGQLNIVVFVMITPSDSSRRSHQTQLTFRFA
jgi:hypothetical protein